MEKQYQENSDAMNALLGKVIQEINFKMGSGWAFEQLLDSIFESLGVLIPYDRIGIALLEDDGTKIRLAWVRSKMTIESVSKGYSSLVVSSSLNALLKSGEPRIIDDLEKYAKEHPESQSTQLILKDGIRSSLTVPLRAEGRSVGVVFFSSRLSHTYNNSHIQIVSSIADEMSVIVEQARLKNFFAEIEGRDKAFTKVLHDLRSPLGVIQGYLDLASGEEWYDSLPENIKEICSILKRNAFCMVELLDEISDHKKKAIGGALPLVLSQVRLSEFLNEVIAAERILATSKEMIFKISIAEKLPEFAILDRNRIRRVIDNLVTNAVKFSNRNKTIQFSVWHEDLRLYFSVKDEGQGIRADEMAGLFREFGQTSTLPSEGERSTGLGLFIARAIVNQHGGEISAESEYGAGSTFTFWIPLKT